MKYWFYQGSSALVFLFLFIMVFFSALRCYEVLSALRWSGILSAFRYSGFFYLLSGILDFSSALRSSGIFLSTFRYSGFFICFPVFWIIYLLYGILDFISALRYSGFYICFTVFWIFICFTNSGFLSVLRYSGFYICFTVFRIFFYCHAFFFHGINCLGVDLKLKTLFQTWFDHISMKMIYIMYINTMSESEIYVYFLIVKKIWASFWITLYYCIVILHNVLPNQYII